MADKQERTLALLGIAATKKPQDKPCPPENIMSAFIENRVNLETRALMLAHLNRCEDCYFTWEQLGPFVALKDVKNLQQNDIEKTEFFQHFENWCNSWISWQTVVPGLALASLAIALVVQIPNSPDQDSYSAPSMAAVTLDADALANSINQLPAPWKNQTFGFTKSTYSASAKAIGAGIWNARRTLLNSKDPLPIELVSEPEIDWQDSEWHDYYAFGKWTLSTWILARADHVEQPQWVLLNQSLQTLETGFEKRQSSEPEAIIALQTIAKLKISLDRLSEKEDFPAQNNLLREIELGLQKLFI
jgi:hypothetical protein